MLAVLLFAFLMACSTMPPGHVTRAGVAQGHAAQVLSPAELAVGKHIVSNGTELPMIKGARDLGLVPAEMRLYFTVSFAIRNHAGLATLIDQQSTPGSGYYHHFLTLSQFENRFGPSQAVYDETMSYFGYNGITAVSTGSRMTLGFTGMATQVENAFNTQIHLYRLGNGSVVYANSVPLSLPVAIGSAVSAVNGLTDIPKVKPMLLHEPLAPSSVTLLGPSGSATGYSSMSEAVNFTSPGYLYTNRSFPFGVTQFLNPSTLTAAYNATPLYGLGDFGQGSTVAVVMAQGYNPSDLSAYGLQVFNNSSQILARLTPYPVNGGTSNATLPGSSLLTGTDAFEFTLDIEYASTMAPGARIDAVYGPSLSIASLVSAYAKLSTLSPVPNVVTNSWGGWEDTWWNLYGPSWQSGAALEDSFMQLTAMGATVLASSGDAGGYDAYSGLLSPAFPASSPYVTAVGGVRTTSVNASGVAFPSPAQFIVNATVAPYGFSEVSSQPAWLPDYPLNGTVAAPSAGEAYWYYGQAISPDVASGGTGLSYWFQQPWWQHGPGVPDTGRRMIADIAAAADFNETVFFAGAWNFFWGGTSFASPTVAGEVALLDTYLNSTLGNTTGRSGYYLGSAQPLLYKLGSDSHLALRPFVQVLSGSNPWDALAAQEGLGWPADQNWTASWTTASAGWDMLSGWGVPDIHNIAVDANALLNVNSSSNQNFVLLNGSVPGVLSDNTAYTFTLVNRTGIPQANASVNISFYNAGAVNTLYTTDGHGTFTFGPTGEPGYLSFFSTTTSGTGFQSVWVEKANLTAGVLSVRVLGQSSLMGGFDFFNGFLSPEYPAIYPLMPNTIAVEVLYKPSQSSQPLEVYNALVTAAGAREPYFSSPPFYPNPYYNNTLAGTDVRSLSLTNLAGIAYVETWNVARTQTYIVNASYLGLNATAYLNVTPRYNIQATNPFAASYSSAYGGLPGYLGLGAINTIVAPSAEGGAEYNLTVRVSDWTGQPLAGVPVDVAALGTGVLPSVLPVAGTAAVTNASGIANITVDQSLTLNAADSGGILLIQAFNASYSASPQTALNGSVVLPLLSNDSCAVLELLQPAFGEVQTMMLINDALVGTPYVGSVGDSASFYVSVPGMAPFTGYNNITAISYRLDASKVVPVPLPAVGQVSFLWGFNLPALAIGMHTLTVWFSDSNGFNYTVPYSFTVIGYGTNPPPTVSITTPVPYSFVTGTTTILFTTEEAAYLISETLSIGPVSYNVMGLDSFAFNASAFGTGPIALILRAVNLNGVASSYSVVLYATPHPVPTASITAPSDYSVFSGLDNITIGLVHGGDYLLSETLTVIGPGVDATYNTSGADSVMLSGLSRGFYSLTYTVTSADGQTASSVTHFTVLSTTAPSRNLTSTYVSALAGILMAVALFAGIVFGMAIDRWIRRRRL